jgi:tRNA (guanine-N(7)-)-methyltransferase subunit TRM82
VSPLQTFSTQQDGLWQEDTSVLTALEWFRVQGTETSTDSSGGDAAGVAQKALRDVLYSVENLRKRPGAED